MAISIRVEDGLPITVEQARTILQDETDKFGLFIDLDRVIEYNLEFRLRCKEAEKVFHSFVGGGIQPSQKIQVRDWFMNYFDIPERYFYNEVGKVSFDKKIQANILNANVDEDAKTFLRNYSTWNYYAYRANYLKQYISLPISQSLSSLRHRMVLANPKWGILSTSRLAATSPSLQNIARDMKDIICTPKGWILMRADSGQIEPRITYSHFIDDPVVKDLIILYNDAYYGMLHYCMLDEEIYQHLDQYRVAAPGETGNDPHVLYAHEIADEMKAGRKELKVLALAATYGSALAGRDPVLSKRYTDRIVNHPSRKAWESKVSMDVRRGIEEFHSVFNSVIRPDVTERYRRGTPAWAGHVVRCGINNPIQTTASDLMIHSLYEANKVLCKANKSHIAYYKHDEGAFYIHKSEKWLVDELSEITAYRVVENGKPWIPIDAEVEMGQVVSGDIPSVLNWREYA